MLLLSTLYCSLPKYVLRLPHGQGAAGYGLLESPSHEREKQRLGRREEGAPVLGLGLRDVKEGMWSLGPQG